MVFALGTSRFVVRGIRLAVATDGASFAAAVEEVEVDFENRFAEAVRAIGPALFGLPTFALDEIGVLGEVRVRFEAVISVLDFTDRGRDNSAILLA